jgi:hypothetical protein
VSCCCELVAEARGRLGTQRKGNIHHSKSLPSYGSEVSVPDTDKLFIKLLREKSETDILRINWNNFVMLSAAAKFENPSMCNYRGGQETAAGGHIDKIVTTYLRVRNNLAISSIIRSTYDYLDPNDGRQVMIEREKISQGKPTILGIAADEQSGEEMPRMRMRTPQREENLNTPSTH